MKTIVSLWIIICGYAFSQAQVCDPSIAPSNLQAFVSSTTVQLTWDHTPYSDYALIEGTTPGGESIRKLIASSMPDTEPSALIVPASKFSTGTHTWTVKAACSLFPPYSLSAASDVDSFDVGEPFICGDSMADVEGNAYATVQIGDQCWMAENLATETYGDGSAIPTGLSYAAWSSTTSGACAVYADDPANKGTYGLLYNWYAVVDPRGLCPAGWHVPTNGEWKELTDHLGGKSTAGGAMKTTGTLGAGTGLWANPNKGATNSSGFSGLPGGFRYGGAGVDYNYLGTNGYWWSATEATLPHAAWERLLTFDRQVVYRYGGNKEMGFSVRCVRDE